MAAAAKKIQLVVTGKVPMQNGRALYFGTALGGTEYETGGVGLEEDAVNSRFKMPERWDFLKIDNVATPSVFVAPNKVKLTAETTVGTSTETGLSEYKSAADMKTNIPAGTPFFGIGLA